MPRNRPKLTFVTALLACVAVGGAFLYACSNSILRNTTEAGLESALDDPLPTPTVKK